MKMDIWQSMNTEAKNLVQKTFQFWRDKNVRACGVEHFLYILITNKHKSVMDVLSHFKIDTDVIIKDIENNTFGKKVIGGKRDEGQLMNGMTFTSEFADAVATAFMFINMEKMAYTKGADMLTVEHLFIGMATSDTSKLAAYLNERGITEEAIKSYMMNMGDCDIVDNYVKMTRNDDNDDSGVSNVGDSNEATDTMERDLEDDNDSSSMGKGSSFTKTKGKSSTGRTPVLDQLCTNLTAYAAVGKIGPIIGRENEINIILEIMCRKNKRNAILLGDPGVGKTAIVEGVAIALYKGQVPYPLKNKKLYQLNVVDLVAGTRYRGDFEERMKHLMMELVNSKNVILFIDEIHTIMGAGNSTGGMDIGNTLKPALARGDIQVIGATTEDEYSKYFMKDGALERRFQSIHIKEPDDNGAITILEGLKDTFQEYHSITIDDSAIEAAIRYSKQYMPNKFMPDKCIDLIDIAGAKTKMATMDVPDDITLMQDQLAEVIKKKIEAANKENFDTAAKYHKKETNLREKLLKREKQYYGSIEESKVTIDENNIADIISRLTGIPTDKLTENESEKLLNMENHIKERLIGQDPAVSSVCRAIRRARTDLHEKKKPIGSFLFMGPTGVGKTELARCLAIELFGKEDNIIKLDMTEYMERFDVSKLLGAPPGFVGYEEGGKLTEAVRKKPYSIVLFDEIEKAHPDVYNILLQILEDGVVTDAKGRQVFFNNCIIILTSNIGAEKALINNQIGFIEDKEAVTLDRIRSIIEKEAQMMFRPEFLNRLDDMIIFQSLKHEHLKVIVDQTMKKLNARITHRDIDISITENMRERIIEVGYDPKYGARPIKRAIQSLVEDYVADKLLRNEIKNHMSIELDYDKDKKEVIHSITRDEHEAFYKKKDNDNTETSTLSSNERYIEDMLKQMTELS